jgi:hypothetical protein
MSQCGTAEQLWADSQSDEEQVIMKRVSDLTVEQLTDLIRFAVDQALEDYFGDPDEGLELRPEVIERLKESQKRLRRGEKGIPLEEVAKQMGINLEE